MVIIPDDTIPKNTIINGIHPDTMVECNFTDKNIGYQCYSASPNRLKKEKNINLEEERYNYFFLHKEKHNMLINSLTKI